jgi:hypothetical protein
MNVYSNNKYERGIGQQNGRACANTLDRASPVMRSMQKKTHTGLHISGTDAQSRQAFRHVQIESPANGDPESKACGEAITEANQVALYFSRPAGYAGYIIGQCRCSDHNNDLISLFTLGVRELVVDGRVGQCRITGRNPNALAASGDAQPTLSHADRDGGAATIEPLSAGRDNDE